jgi:hypothetical protein
MTLTFIILEQIVPEGILIEMRYLNIENDNQVHGFVCLKPLDAKNDDKTLVIDPWPS